MAPCHGAPERLVIGRDDAGRRRDPRPVGRSTSSRRICRGALDAAGVGRLAQLLRGASIPIVDAPAETVWIWSDLHLGDQALLAVGQRPFSTTLEMDDYLLEAWRRRVGLQDLIICLGDVVHPEAEPSTVAALRNCPGRRLLVDQQVAVLCATDPPLALTHVPLQRVPADRDQRPRAPARSAGAEPTAPQTSASSGPTTRPSASTSSYNDSRPEMAEATSLRGRIRAGKAAQFGDRGLPRGRVEEATA